WSSTLLPDHAQPHALQLPRVEPRHLLPEPRLLPRQPVFLDGPLKSRPASKIATGDSPNFETCSAIHPPEGATRMTGSPGKYAILPHSFWFSISGSDQPYALRNMAIDASRLLTAITTFSTPETGAPFTLSEVCTRHARGVWSSMMKGSTEPGGPEPTS